MKRNNLLLRCASGLLLLLILAPSALSQSRTWTSAEGQTLEGEILALEGGEVTLKTSRGNFALPLSRLSETDQAFAKEWKEKQAGTPLPAGAAAAAGDKSPGDFESLKLGDWPTIITADFEVSDIQVVKEDREAGEYVYRSPHFEFHSPLRLSTTVVREFSRIFEATFEFAKAIPIGLGPEPRGEGYYLTKLYQSREDYYAGGGMPGSGGMFSYSWRGNEILKSEIHVPLSNLGVEYTGTRYIVDHKKRSDTLVHEIVHQMTGRWLPLLPTWFTEGLAETISCQRYDSGRFTLTSMDRSIREDVTRRSGSDREFEMLNLRRLMEITGREWADDLASPAGGRLNYPSANVLFYYFVRLDGEGDAAHLVEYMKAIAGGAGEEEARAASLLRGRDYETLQQDVAAAWRSRGLRLSYR